MSYFINICFICLKYSNNLTFISSSDTNEASFEDKLKYFLPGIELKPSIPKYICAKCGHNLNRIREFKQKCLQNITAYEKYAQQVTTTDSSYKYLYVDLSPDFVALKQTEMNLETINSEEFIIEEQMDESTENKNKKLFNCEICNKSLTTLQSLNSHKQIHTNTKLHTCKMCKKSFRQLRHLKNHQLIHANKKPHTCKICKQSFRLVGHLKNHQVVHSNKKVFTCEVCNESFGRSETFKQHKRVHTGKLCNKTINTKQHAKKRVFNEELPEEMDQQLRIHSGAVPYYCKHCCQSFEQLIHLCSKQK